MNNWEKTAEILLKGGVVVLPTDTIYGLHCLASSMDAVGRVYSIKGRSFTSPFIILIPHKDSLVDFGVRVDADLSKLLNEYWPGPNSIILPVLSGRLSYLHRGTNSLAFRSPDYPELQELLKKTGPLISTSANPSGKTAALNIEDAKAYFGETVDYYLDGGTLNKPPSKVLKIEQGIPIYNR